MKKPTFNILDVFAEEKYAGNQLAVFREVGNLSDIEMQKIAREINFSETTFILSDQPQDGSYRVRIFTPKTEVPFAGHPTLGTAYVIQQEIIKRPVAEVHLHLKVGQIPVSFDYHQDVPQTLWMRQQPPTFGPVFTPAEIAAGLKITEDVIDRGFPIQEVSTGLPFILVPLKSLAAVQTTPIVRVSDFDLIHSTQSKAVMIFAPECHEPANQLHVRVYADFYGVPEDPATGSANGCLAGYLAKHRYFGNSKVDIRVEQGHEMGRSSLLFLRAQESGNQIEVTVGGKVVPVATGVWD